MCRGYANKCAVNLNSSVFFCTVAIVLVEYAVTIENLAPRMTVYTKFGTSLLYSRNLCTILKARARVNGGHNVRETAYTSRRIVNLDG